MSKITIEQALRITEKLYLGTYVQEGEADGLLKEIGRSIALRKVGIDEDQLRRIVGNMVACIERVKRSKQQ